MNKPWDHHRQKQQGQIKNDTIVYDEEFWSDFQTQLKSSNLVTSLGVKEFTKQYIKEKQKQREEQERERLKELEKAALNQTNTRPGGPKAGRGLQNERLASQEHYYTPKSRPRRARRRGSLMDSISTVTSTVTATVSTATSVAYSSAGSVASAPARLRRVRRSSLSDFVKKLNLEDEC